MRSALNLAFDLFDFPSQARVARKAPLPPDLVLLLRIAAGKRTPIREAVRVSGRPMRGVRDAAGFFIEQVMLFPEADSYRVLGASPTAENFELRRNMALLLRWLHPDIDQKGERSIFAARVTKAWSDLKRPSGARRTTDSCLSLRQTPCNERNDDRGDRRAAAATSRVLHVSVRRKDCCVASCSRFLVGPRFDGTEPAST